MAKHVSTALPTKADFDPWGDLDAQWAWRNFGGLTLDEAHARFRENPLNYQEDFMFMGPRAFAYYFPVIEQYLRNVPVNENEHDHQAWILAHAIKHQFDPAQVDSIKNLAPAVMDLADYVQAEIVRFGAEPFEQERVADAWSELVAHLKAVLPAKPVHQKRKKPRP